ncbi:MAG TPA: hypothetical protein ENN29_02995 [Candidatus Hydrogenedentes bacterium]|nr:hypothetical protein [Candidatus Hydrogenedentota bacterium]
MAATHSLQKMTKKLGDFVVKQQGVWNHEEWETLCGEIAALGVDMDDSFQEHLGLLLEHLRVFYFCMPATAATKRRTKAKAKPRAKAKAAQPEQAAS